MASMPRSPLRQHPRSGGGIVSAQSRTLEEAFATAHEMLDRWQRWVARLGPFDRRSHSAGGNGGIEATFAHETAPSVEA